MDIAKYLYYFDSLRKYTDKLIQIAINQPLCTGLENGVNQR